MLICKEKLSPTNILSVRFSFPWSMYRPSRISSHHWINGLSIGEWFTSGRLCMRARQKRVSSSSLSLLLRFVGRLKLSEPKFAVNPWLGEVLSFSSMSSTSSIRRNIISQLWLHQILARVQLSASAPRLSTQHLLLEILYTLLNTLENCYSDPLFVWK